MAWHDLRQFVDHLERRGRLRRVSVPVSRDLEITEITDRVSKASGDANVALLFERVDGAEMPVVINAFGSAERMAWALGVDRLDDLGERVAQLLRLTLPGTFAERWRKLGMLLDVVKGGPRHGGTAPGPENGETPHPAPARPPGLRVLAGH